MSLSVRQYRQRADRRTTTRFPSISLQLIHLTFAVFQHRHKHRHADCTRIIRSSPKHTGVQEPIRAECDCSTQTFLNIPLVKVVVRVQTEHMPVIQAKRFELPHPRGHTLNRAEWQRNPTTLKGTMAPTDAGPCSLLQPVNPWHVRSVLCRSSSLATNPG